MLFTDEDIDAPSQRFVDAFVAWGSIEQVEDRISEHFDAGADHVCIQPLTVNGTYSAGKECDKCKPKQSQRALVAEVTAALKKLNSGSRIVWCATKIYAFETTELFCRENDGKKYSTKALADTEHKRLKATPSTSSSSNSDAALELEYWNVVKKSNDVDLLQAYLDEYPNGKFAPLAKIKIKKLK